MSTRTRFSKEVRERAVRMLIESAKLCGVEPRAYLREATLRAIRSPGTATLAHDPKSPES